MRGQATIEYVVILAFALILAVAAISTLGGIPGIGGDTQSDIEKVYWSQSAEIGIPNFRVATDGSASFSIDNKRSEMIKIKSLHLKNNDSDYSITSIAGKIMNPLESITVSGTVGPCEKEKRIEYNVTFTYELVEQELGIFIFSGDKPLVGKCQ